MKKNQRRLNRKHRKNQNLNSHYDFVYDSKGIIGNMNDKKMKEDLFGRLLGKESII